MPSAPFWTRTIGSMALYQGVGVLDALVHRSSLYAHRLLHDALVHIDGGRFDAQVVDSFLDPSRLDVNYIDSR